MLLDASASLPNVRTLSVMYGDDKYSVQQVPQFTATLRGFGELKCVHLGVFETTSMLESQRKSKIVFKSCSLALNLPDIRRLLGDNDMAELLTSVRNLIEGDSIVSRKCVVTQFAPWKATYDLWRKWDGLGKSGPAFLVVHYSGQRLFEWSEAGMGGVVWTNDDLPKDIRLVDLNPVEHSAGMLEWATEMMTAASRNMVESRPGKWGLEIGE